MTASLDAEARLLACHDCDLVQRIPTMVQGQRYACSRCRALLVSRRRQGVGDTLVLTLTALLLFAVANTSPFVVFELGERAQHTTLFGAVLKLIDDGELFLGAVVLLTSIVAPLLKLLGLLYVTLPLVLGRVPPRIGGSWRALLWLKPWGMLEVYLLASFVAFIKLSETATLQTALGFYAFVGLLLMETFASACFDPAWIWSRRTSADGKVS